MSRKQSAITETLKSGGDRWTFTVQARTSRHRTLEMIAICAVSP
jgi:hypothetical protein